MSLNFKYMCRLCLRENEKLLSIFSEESQPSLTTKIRSFAPILKIVVGDGLPEQVCEQCAHQVDRTYKFKLQCEHSDAVLRETLNNQSSQNESEDVQLSIISTGNDSRNQVMIKREVKEETFICENEGESHNKEEGLCDSDFSDSSDSWPDFQADTPSSKVKEVICTPEIKQQVSSCVKAHKKGRKKLLKEETTEIREVHSKPAIENPKYSNQTKPAVTDNVKIEDNEMKHKVNVKMKKKSHALKVFQCHDCGKDFAKKAQLILHMSGHTGSKPFICNQCCRTFASRINLKKHLFTHTGQKPYLCTHCGVFFGRIDTLTKHTRSHTGEKPFHCNVCGNSFARRSTFTNHMRTHSGDKPYLCTECGWRCVQSYDLKKHMRCHTGEKPYSCSVCKMSFGQRNSLTKHMRSHLGDMPVPVPVDCVQQMQFRCQVYDTKEFNNFPLTSTLPTNDKVP